MAWIKSVIRRSAKPIHHHLRSSKAEKFIKLLSPARTERLLDVGGGTGMNGEFVCLYKKFYNVTVINLEPPGHNSDGLCDFRVIIADGRSLPFESKSFDWVFSNAVIEHVGEWEDQLRFASEIRRVASKGYFITTPNLYFPIEPHALLPLYQFYPERLKPLALHLSPGYMREVEHIELLTKKKLQVLFPEAKVQPVNLASSLIAFYVA